MIIGMRDACALQQPARRSRWVPVTVTLLLFSLFAALGTWQVQRREWKHALIARVEHRVHAAPVAAPGPWRWAGMTAATDDLSA
jgi:surfeit locus 1 family protein